MRSLWKDGEFQAYSSHIMNESIETINDKLGFHLEIGQEDIYEVHHNNIH